MYKLLDRMESVIMDGIPIPLLPYSLINQDKLIKLLDKIQTVIPDEIQQADQLLRRKEELQHEAQAQAQKILLEAKQQSDYMLSDSELMRAVHLEAERVRQQVMAELESLRQQTMDEVEAIRHKAFEEAKAVRESAEDYADEVLKTLTRNLDEFQNVAKTAQKQLKRTRVDGMQQQHPKATVRSGQQPPKAKEPSRPNRSENTQIGV